MLSFPLLEILCSYSPPDSNSPISLLSAQVFLYTKISHSSSTRRPLLSLRSQADHWWGHIHIRHSLTTGTQRRALEVYAICKVCSVPWERRWTGFPRVAPPNKTPRQQQITLISVLSTFAIQLGKTILLWLPNLFSNSLNARGKSQTSSKGQGRAQS